MGDWTEASFVGGDPALDFLNTAGGRTRLRDAERLHDLGDALSWGRFAGVLTEGEDERLRAGATPEDARRVVVDLRDRREALHAFLLAAVGVAPCSDETRARVHDDVAGAYRIARLDEHLDVGPAWVVDLDVAGDALLAHRLALATAALLGGERRRQIRLCGRCSWFFLDPSPTRRRRWCSMAACGNRAKAQRHQARRPG